MLIPSRKKYKSCKRKSLVENNRVINFLQMECYKGNFPMTCGKSCPIYKSCWFCGLKPVKE